MANRELHVARHRSATPKIPGSSCCNKWTATLGLLILSSFIFFGCKSGPARSKLLTPFTASPLKVSPMWHESYDVAIQKSRETGKPVLANFTSSVSCSWCVKLKRDVFETEAFAEWAEDNVVLLSLDFQQPSKLAASVQRQNQELAARHQIKGYPTVVILDSQENALGELGYMDDPEKWIAKAQSFIQRN